MYCNELNQNKIPIIGLAKRDETIIIHKNLSVFGKTIDQQNLAKQFSDNPKIIASDDFIKVNFSKNSHIVKLLQRIRDESHRFAVSYHHVAKKKQQTLSVLDSVPGIGPSTRKKLLNNFGSLKSIKTKNQDDLAKVIGAKKAATLMNYLSES